jgi:ParB family chromosome partitioning protein
MGHARALLAHPDPETAAVEVLKKGFSVRQTEAMVQQLARGVRKPATARAAMDGEAEALATSLTERLGLRVTVKHNGEGGSVTLNYRDLNQLDFIVTLLNG